MATPSRTAQLSAWQRFLWWMGDVLIFFFVSSIAAVFVFKWLPVYFTPLMAIRSVEQVFDGKSPVIHHHWVSLDSISTQLPQAVMASEDNLFLRHNGFDMEQIYRARLEAIKGKRERGASTISQQTAKNVFLWPGHSWIRKGLEAYFTFLIEKIWGKRRIMEVYLNSIEMGQGIFGAHAVAQHHFDTTPDQLTKRQASLIAASLPNPRKYNSAEPSAWMNSRSATIRRIMGQIDRFSKTANEHPKR